MQIPGMHKFLTLSYIILIMSLILLFCMTSGTNRDFYCGGFRGAVVGGVLYRDCSKLKTHCMKVLLYESVIASMQINFGRPARDACPAFLLPTDNSANVQPAWSTLTVSGTQQLRVDIGPSGGSRGYLGITGEKPSLRVVKILIQNILSSVKKTIEVISM